MSERTVNRLSLNCSVSDILTIDGGRPFQSLRGDAGLKIVKNGQKLDFPKPAFFVSPRHPLCVCEVLFTNSNSKWSYPAIFDTRGAADATSASKKTPFFYDAKEMIPSADRRHVCIVRKLVPSSSWAATRQRAMSNRSATIGPDVDHAV